MTKSRSLWLVSVPVRTQERSVLLASKGVSGQFGANTSFDDAHRFRLAFDAVSESLNNSTNWSAVLIHSRLAADPATRPTVRSAFDPQRRHGFRNSCGRRRCSAGATPDKC